MQKHIEEGLKKHWSPEQISGRLKIDYLNETEKQAGKDSVYKWIYAERKDLVKYLRCKKGNYRKRCGTKIREKQRKEILYIGKEKTKRLFTNVDRKSGYGIIKKLEKVSLEEVHNKLEEIFNELPKSKKFTFTYDNGTEIGKEDEWLEKKLGITIYRAYPYHIWERGTNENFNGLVREFFPKGMEFANIKESEIKKAQNLLNNRPRKRLNYLTPKEVFFNKKLRQSD